MTLPDMKALKELLKLLRSQGVLQYQSTDLNLVLSENPPPVVTRRSKAELEKAYSEASDEYDEDPNAEIERLIDYSSRPPAEDL